jgi:hypothetical protein
VGDDKAALRYSQQALLIAQELDDRPMQGHAQAGLGHTAEALKSYQQALKLRHELDD